MPSRNSTIVLTGLGVGLLALLAGCPRPNSADKDAAARLPLAGVKLRLLVVDDPALARAAGKLQGEWRAQTGATLEVAETTESELLARNASKADAAICPSYLLGTLAEQAALAEIPESLRADEQENWSEIFELPRCHEAAWGQAILAVPFGSPVLVCYYRADLLKQLGREPPRTWTEYHELAKLLADPAKLGQAAPPADAPWFGTMEPLGPGWGGLVLLARASSYVKHPHNYSTWFNMKNMEPLVDSPPMIHALTQLADTATKHGSPDQLDADPDKTRAAIWQGTCGMALSWPTAACSVGGENGDAGRRPAIGVAELPGSRKHYNIDHDVDEIGWETRDHDAELSVPLLATSGRLGVVFRRSARPGASAELLLWLSALRTDPPPASRSPWTTLSRRWQLGSPDDWVEGAMSPAAAAAYANQTATTFDRGQWTFALRIPGRRRYLAALDDAVAAAVRDKQAPAAALAEAATKWRRITEELGVDRQRTAYLRSLGLEP